MATNTTPDNIPKPETGDQLAPLEVWFQSQADAIQAALTNRFKGLPLGSYMPGLPVGSDGERDTIYPAPAQGNNVYRTDKGYFEAYYGTYNASSNPGGRSPAGWYPVELATLPDPIVKNYGNTVNVSATSWAALPSIGSASLTLFRPAWVQMSLGAWMSNTTGSHRAGIKVTGATSIDPQEDSKWGEVLYAESLQGSTQQFFSKVRRINAGTTTFQAYAYRTGGTAKVNYPVMEITPLRWA